MRLRVLAASAVCALAAAGFPACAHRGKPARGPGGSPAPAPPAASARSEGSIRGDSPREPGIEPPDARVAPGRVAAEADPRRTVLPDFESPSPGPGRTPRQTYEAAKVCIARADYLGAWALFSRRARAEADGALPPAIGERRFFDPRGFLAEFGMTPDEFEKLPVPEQYALLSLSSHRRNPAHAERFAGSEFVSESVDGDSAEVVYRASDGSEARMRLVREEGLWRLARPRF